jgi:hypothetical protein
MNILDVGRGATFACERRSRVKMGDVIASTSIDIYIGCVKYDSTFYNVN